MSKIFFDLILLNSIARINSFIANKIEAMIPKEVEQKIKKHIEINNVKLTLFT